MKLFDRKRITLGTCYYPEHWDRTLWEEDLDRMKEAGIETVRIAEFAWILMEPSEGCFDFSLFEDFLNLADSKGMNVIVGTPTATPPAWLTEKYPEVLNADIRGTLYRHGARRQYNYNSPKYRELCTRIVEKMAEAYAKHPSVVGWQIDNELNCELDEFYSESDTVAFREFLKKKYGTVEKLNKAWGAVVWSQCYTGWEEIFVPRYTIHGTVNPHQVLDYKRFVSDSVCRFAKLQSDILRKYVKPGDFITTNGMFNLDNNRLTEESLNVYTYDSYPNFAYCVEAYKAKDPMKDRKWSRHLAETRAVCQPFGIMEQQSGANGWNTRMMAPTPEPGQMTLWTLQSIAHGADFVSFFRWRTAPFGTEMYWHGILDYSGRDNARLAETKAIHQIVQKLDDAAGGIYQAQAAVVCDYDNTFDAQLDRWHEMVERQSGKALFEAFQQTHTPFDYLYLDHAELKDLERYKVLFYPHASIMNAERAAMLKAYVENGGKLVFGCRSGYKDMDGQCVMDLLPGHLRDLTGTDIPEYTLISPKFDGIVHAEWDGASIETAVFNDRLTPLEGGEVLARYTENYYAGEPALIRKKLGKGEAYYFGGAFTEKTAEVFFEKLGIREPYKKLFDLPEGVELAVRKKEDTEFFFVLNYQETEQTLQLHAAFHELITDQHVSGSCTLKPYGTMVLRLK